ncbi:MAG: DUF1987 domain-containing protein [Spirochaetaceae bacterium]
MIDIAVGKSTPRILFDEENRLFTIDGQSYPENSSNFYEPVITWVEEYLEKEGIIFELNVRLLYLNTSSTKAMFYLFDILEEAFKKGKKVSVNWLYNADNEVAKETGEDLLEDFQFPYNIKVID